ncbi:MAG: hypothetical protein U0X91_27680 [Spirosomataceae bacterium]
MKPFRFLLAFTLQKYRLHIFGGFSFFVAVLLFCYYRYTGVSKILSQYWTNAIDPAITVFSFLFPLILSIYLLQKEWKESLEKRLTVHFKLKDKYVMSCYEAYLSSESDIRLWGQQIGLQMNGGQLNFYPYMTQVGPKLCFDSSKNAFYNLYELTIFLKFDKNGNYQKSDKDVQGFIISEYRIWFDNNSDLPGNEEIKNFVQSPPPSLEQVKTAHKNAKQKPDDEKAVSS